MRGRFQRGGQAAISFFAFQDIITSVIGILIVITLLLALHLDEAVPLSTDAPVNPGLEEKLRGLLDALAAMRADLAAAPEPAADPQAMAAGNAILRQKIEAAKEKAREGRATAARMAGDRSGDAARADIAKARADAGRLQAEMETLRRQAAESQAAMTALEVKVKQREAALLAERDRKNVLRLIPEKSQTSKEPVLALVTGRGISLQRFDAGETVQVRGVAEFRDALAQFSKLDQYLVLYFKPSGAEDFTKLTEAVRAAGFELGYDAIPEDFEVEFRSKPAPAP
jgi:hypothetical protein